MTEHLEQRVREIEQWSAEHDGKTNAKWDEQDRENERCDKDRGDLRLHMEQNFGLVFRELTSLKTKVATWAGVAAVLGAAAAKYLLP